MEISTELKKAVAWAFAYSLSGIGAFFADSMAGTADIQTFQTAVKAVFAVLMAVLLIKGKRMTPCAEESEAGPGLVLLIALIPVSLLAAPRVFVPSEPLPEAHSAALVLAALFTVLAEELLFRGYADLLLRSECEGQKRCYFAAAVYALAYGIRGLTSPIGAILAMSMSFCIGLLLQALYFKSRSLLPGILAHAVISGVSILSDYAGKSGALNFGKAGMVMYLCGVLLSGAAGRFIISYDGSKRREYRS